MAFLPPLASKPELRLYFRRLRRSVDLPRLAIDIRQQLRDFPPLQKAHTVFTYLATGSEINLDALCLIYPEKVWGVPRCLPNAQLSWHRYCPTDPIVLNSWGIREPLPEAESLSNPDCILVPALACDLWGIRLGYGGGFYDRFLSQVSGCRVGVVPSACLSPDPLPRDPWDVPLHHIVTEQGVVLVQS